MTGSTTSGNFPVGERRADHARRDHRRGGRLCALDEFHPDVELFDLVRRQRDGQRPGDRGGFERMDLDCGRYPIHRFADYGRIPGLADRHAKHVRGGLRSVRIGRRDEIYSIYIGGTHWDEAYGIAVAPDGTVWLAGGTYSPDIWIQGQSLSGALWRRRRCLYRSHQSRLGRESFAVRELPGRQRNRRGNQPGAGSVRPDHRQRVYAVFEFSGDEQRVSDQVRRRYGCLYQRFGHREKAVGLFHLLRRSRTRTLRWT